MKLGEKYLTLIDEFIFNGGMSIIFLKKTNYEERHSNSRY